MENKNGIADYMKLANLKEKFEGKYFKLNEDKTTHINYVLFIQKIIIDKFGTKYEGNLITFRGNEFSFKLGKFNFGVSDQIKFKEITKKQYRALIHIHFDKII